MGTWPQISLWRFQEPPTSQIYKEDDVMSKLHWNEVQLHAFLVDWGLDLCKIQYAFNVKDKIRSAVWNKGTL
jgi:hypothetical protein